MGFEIKHEQLTMRTFKREEGSYEGEFVEQNLSKGIFLYNKINIIINFLFYSTFVHDESFETNKLF